MENVPGMLSHNGRNVAELIAESMEGIGYKTTWAVLNAMDYGVPQVRHRLFFVGVRNDSASNFASRSSTDARRQAPLSADDRSRRHRGSAHTAERRTANGFCPTRRSAASPTTRS